VASVRIRVRPREDIGGGGFSRRVMKLPVGPDGRPPIMFDAKSGGNSENVIIADRIEAERRGSRSKALGPRLSVQGSRSKAYDQGSLSPLILFWAVIKSLWIGWFPSDEHFCSPYNSLNWSTGRDRYVYGGPKKFAGVCKIAQTWRFATFRLDPVRRELFAPSWSVWLNNGSPVFAAGLPFFCEKSLTSILDFDITAIMARRVRRTAR